MNVERSSLTIGATPISKRNSICSGKSMSPNSAIATLSRETMGFRNEQKSLLMDKSNDKGVAMNSTTMIDVVSLLSSSSSSSSSSLSFSDDTKSKPSSVSFTMPPVQERGRRKRRRRAGVTFTQDPPTYIQSSMCGWTKDEIKSVCWMTDQEIMNSRLSFMVIMNTLKAQPNHPNPCVVNEDEFSARGLEHQSVKASLTRRLRRKHVATVLLHEQARLRSSFGCQVNEDNNSGGGSGEDEDGVRNGGGGDRASHRRRQQQQQQQRRASLDDQTLALVYQQVACTAESQHRAYRLGLEDAIEARRVLGLMTIVNPKNEDEPQGGWRDIPKSQGTIVATSDAETTGGYASTDVGNSSAVSQPTGSQSLAVSEEVATIKQVDCNV